MAVVIKPGSHVAKYAWITIETINRLNGNEIQKKFLNCIPQESRGAPIWYVAPTSNRRDASKLEVKSTEYGGAKNEFRALSCLLEKILDDATPTFEFRKGIFETAFTELEGKIAGRAKEDWNFARKELELALFERGYRESILTPFELVLSTGKGVEGKLNVPVAVQNGVLTIEEASNARELVAVECGRGEFFKMRGATLESISFALYPLDGYGMPMVNPGAIDRERLSEALREFGIREAFERCLINGIEMDADRVKGIAKMGQSSAFIGPA